MNYKLDQDTLGDAAHDAFMAFWRAMDTEQADALWEVYCAAQERFERWLLAQRSAPVVEGTVDEHDYSEK